MTTKAVIQLLPFDEEFKAKLLADFDMFTPDQKFNIIQIVWNAYNAYFQLKLDQNIEEAIARAADGEDIVLDQDFYKRMKEKTNNEISTQLNTVSTTVELSQTREELEKLLNQSH